VKIDLLENTMAPSPRLTALLATVIAVAPGTTAGIGGYTFVYAKGASYLSNDPRACANCHIMQDHLDGWVKSSHRSVATCNDCHTPSGLIPKYFTKAEHGFFHSLAFTTGEFHDPIQIKHQSLRVAENACRKCDRDIVHDMEAVKTYDTPISCVRCHADVGHQE
jgi:cytochrome c nitrite reductase small subunit